MTNTHRIKAKGWYASAGALPAARSRRSAFTRGFLASRACSRCQGAHQIHLEALKPNRAHRRNCQRKGSTDQALCIKQKISCPSCPALSSRAWSSGSSGSSYKLSFNASMRACEHWYRNSFCQQHGVWIQRPMSIQVLAGLVYEEMERHKMGLTNGSRKRSRGRA